MIEALKRALRFDGDTIVPERDNQRLDRQMGRVLLAMGDGRWHTLEYLSNLTGDPQASVSARLRDLRKPRWGSRFVERRYVKQGLFEYRLIPLDSQAE